MAEKQIAFALKQAELGTKVEAICRKLGISVVTFCNWKTLQWMTPAEFAHRLRKSISPDSSTKPAISTSDQD